MSDCWDFDTDTDTETAPENEGDRHHEGGLYDLPIVGSVLGHVRNFYDDLAPTESDGVPLTVAKEVFRHASIIVVASAAAVVML